MEYEITANSLSKTELKQLRQAIRYGAKDVATARKMLHTGPIGAFVMAILGVGLCLLISLILPFLVIFAPFVFGYFLVRAGIDNKRWARLLPAEADNKLIKIT